MTGRTPKMCSADELEGFLKSEIATRISRTQVALALGAILMPAGVSLDWFLHHTYFWQLSLVRSITSLVLLAGYWVSKTAWAQARISLFSLVMLLVPALAITGMLFLTAGGESSYFYGLILLMIFVQLLGFTAKEATIYCGITLTAYLLSVFLHPNFTWDISPRLVVGPFFMATSSILSVTICHLNARNRLTDYLLRRSLDDKNRQLEQQDVQRMSFLANVSHELRTPLSMIIGPLDDVLQSRGQVSEPIGQSLAIIKRNANRLRILVDDLLDIVRLDNAKFRLELEDVDAREIVFNCAATVLSMAKSRNIDLDVQCTSTPLDLRVDVHRIERVLLNLLSNAIKFSPQNSTIQLRLSQDRSSALVEISDRGPGIPEEDRERVFERHFQSSSTASSSSSGLGLGLAIAREIVQSHGGKIWIEPNEPGTPEPHDDGHQSGCRCCVSIPITNSIEHADATHQPKQRLAGAPMHAKEMEWKSIFNSTMVDEANGQNETDGNTDLSTKLDVLVIDDEDDLRDFLANSLRNEFTVASAANAKLGLALAQMRRPSCILLDFMLPDGDGLSVLKRIKQDPDMLDTKILMLTAHFDENIKLQALQLGADDFLSKPFGISEMRARVATLIRNSRLQADLRQEKKVVKEALAKQRETESRLFQSEKMRAVSSMAAGLLHEMNNPISYSMMAVSILKRQLQVDSDSRLVVEDIESGMLRVSEIVSDLRAFAYPEQGHIKAPFAIGQAVQTALRFAKHDLDGIRVEFEEDRMNALMVEASKSQVTQVILNLVSNSVHALRQKRDNILPSIRIDARVNQSRVLVSVEDNGPGIPNRILERVLEPFFTTSQPNEGLGLGLSICNTIVQNHGGQIQIETQEHIGTKIVFDLPIVTLEKQNDNPTRIQYQTDSVCR